jgi:hypothetical protein
MDDDKELKERTRRVRRKGKLESRRSIIARGVVDRVQ